MFVTSKNNGIGEVIESQEKFSVVYFFDIDEEKKVLNAFTVFFDTIEEAQANLEPKDEIDVEAIKAKIKAEQEEKRNAIIARHRIEEMNLASSKELMKHI